MILKSVRVGSCLPYERVGQVNNIERNRAGVSSNLHNSRHLPLFGMVYHNSVRCARP